MLQLSGVQIISHRIYKIIIFPYQQQAVLMNRGKSVTTKMCTGMDYQINGY